MANFTPDKKESQATEGIGKVKSKRRKILGGFADMSEEVMSPSVVERMRNCGYFVKFIVDKEGKRKRLVQANFCNNRFCPICAWRRARKDAFKIDVLMRWIEGEHKKAFIFLTLTAPNVKGDKLKESITVFNKAFERLIKLDEVVSVSKGYIRKLEITYDNDPIITWDMYHGNPERHIKSRKAYYKARGLKIGDENPNYDTYHPHFHVIMTVNQSYFKDKTYIRQSRWLELWRQSMRDESITQLDVRRVKRETAGTEQAELAKYAAKDTDMMISSEVFKDFYRGLKNRQVLTFNGLMAEGHAKYKKGELDYLRPIDQTVYAYMILYEWGRQDYIEKEKRELTEMEILQFNRQLMDEVEIE